MLTVRKGDRHYGDGFVMELQATQPDDLEDYLAHAHLRFDADVPEILWDLAVAYIRKQRYSVQVVGRCDEVWDDLHGIAEQVLSFGLCNFEKKSVAVVQAPRASMISTLLHEAVHVYQRVTPGAVDWYASRHVWNSADIEFQAEAMMAEIVRYFGGNCDAASADYIANTRGRFDSFAIMPYRLHRGWVETHFWSFLAALYDASASGSAP